VKKSKPKMKEKVKEREKPKRRKKRTNEFGEMQQNDSLRGGRTNREA
jgi:hypothetical protein